MPVLGTCFRLLGHQPVHFLKDEEGKFSVDKVKQAPVNALIQKHVSSGGGILTFCPEGAINKRDPHHCLPHRRGSFQQAIDLRLPIYGFTSFGNHHFWPNSLPVAGNRATIACGTYEVSEWNDLLASGKSIDHITTTELSTICQAAMQKSVDAVSANHKTYTCSS